MKYVVTGGAGFIGSNLVDQLILNDNEVHVIDNFSTGEKKNCNSNAVYHELDISSPSNLKNIKNILHNTDTIFHLACKARVQPSINDPVDYEMNNTLGTSIMLKSAVDSDVRRFIYSSSSSVYGDCMKMPMNESSSPNPLSPYGAQKYYGEVLCKTFYEVYGIETVSLRYFNVYGERQNVNGAYALVIGIFINQKQNNSPLTIRGDGEQKRDFTYVGDVVNANILASKSHKVGKGDIINIGNGDNRSINQIAELIGGEKVHIDSVIEPYETLADIRRAKEKLGWEPTQTLEKWFKEFLRTI